MYRFIRFSTLLVGLFIAIQGYAAEAPLTTADDLGPAVEQPIEFPHNRHAGKHDPSDPSKGGMEIDCQYCHTYARRSSIAGIPPLQKCVGCHNNIESVKDKPRIKKLFEAWEAKKPIQWKKVHDLPDFVRFNHERHIKRFVEQQGHTSQEACGYCHGDVKNMTVARRQKSLSMGWCASCHEKAHTVAASGVDVGKQAYWYTFQKPATTAKVPEDIKAKGPNDCWQCHK